MTLWQNCRVERTYIVGECEICKEERDVLEEIRKIGECGMDKFGTLLLDNVVGNDRYARK